MGSLLGNLTNPGVSTPGGGTQFFNPSQVQSGAMAKALTPQPGTLQPQGTLNPQGAAPPMPQGVRPSFLQASEMGAAPGDLNATSAALTKGGKLAVMLRSGLQGAMAGQAASAQAVQQSGGRRGGSVGQGFEAGYTLPWQQQAQRNKLEQQQAQIALTKAQADMIPTPYGNMPAALARYILPASIREQGTLGAAQIGAGSRVQAAQIGNRFKVVPNVGLFDTQANNGTGAVVPGTQEGITVTPEIAQDYGLPQEYIGRPLPLQQFEGLQRTAISAAPTVRSSTDPLGLTTTTTTRKQLPRSMQQMPQPGSVAPTNAPRQTPAATPPAAGAGNSSLDSMAQRLVDGDIDPSQVPRRSAAYTVILQKADAYSMQKYGQHFDIAGAARDYDYAKNTQTQNTLKMIQGMTEKNGALDIARNAAKSLPQFDEQTVNKIFNAASAEFGSPAASNFHTAMLGLADEYSKVMGGGVSSDTGRDQALALLKASYGKGQLAGAVQIIQQDLAARKSALIGSNRYLIRQYGQSAAPTQAQSGFKPF